MVGCLIFQFPDYQVCVSDDGDLDVADSHPDQRHPDDRKATARILQSGRRSEGSCACFPRTDHRISSRPHLPSRAQRQDLWICLSSLAFAQRPFEFNLRFSALICVKNSGDFGNFFWLSANG